MPPINPVQSHSKAKYNTTYCKWILNIEYRFNFKHKTPHIEAWVSTGVYIESIVKKNDSISYNRISFRKIMYRVHALLCYK